MQATARVRVEVVQRRFAPYNCLICQHPFEGDHPLLLNTKLPRPLRIILSLWIPVWAFYWIWPVVKRPDRLTRNLALISTDSDGRRAIAFGENFHRFLRFCDEKLPPQSSFRLVGVDKSSIDRARALYFLYPRLASTEPEYILVYGDSGYLQPNSELFATLSSSQFILKSASPGLP